MNTFIKQSAILAGITLLSACGSSDGDDTPNIEKLNIPARSNVAEQLIKDIERTDNAVKKAHEMGLLEHVKMQKPFFESGSQKIRQDYLPLRLQVNYMRSEPVKFTIDPPYRDSYSRSVSVALPPVPVGLTYSWRNGYSHSIQVHKNKAADKLTVKFSNNILDDSWAITDDTWAVKVEIPGVEKNGHFIILPKEADIDGKDPIAFVEGLDKEDPAGSYISFINRFTDTNLGSAPSDICLAVIDENNIYPISKSLAQTEATNLIDASTLGHSAVKRLAVMTRGTLPQQQQKITTIQRTNIENFCPEGMGSIQVIETTTKAGSMKAAVIYSIDDGEIAKTETDAQLESLRWKSETDAVLELSVRKPEISADLELLLKESEK